MFLAIHALLTEVNVNAAVWPPTNIATIPKNKLINPNLAILTFFNPDLT
jgi:hypothetical protein